MSDATEALPRLCYPPGPQIELDRAWADADRLYRALDRQRKRYAKLGYLTPKYVIDAIDQHVLEWGGAGRMRAGRTEAR